MPRIAVNGIDLYFEREGQGPPLLALAGMVSDSASWGPLVPGLAARFDLIRPDNRCTGRTRPMPCATGIDAMIDDCLALLDALCIDRAHLLGHSMGAAVALRLAMRRPDRVAAVVAMGAATQPNPLATAVFREVAALAGDTQDPGRFFRLLFPWLFAPAFFARPEAVHEAAAAALAYPHRQPLEGLQAQLALLDTPLPPLDLDAIGMPIYAIGGAEDRLVLPHSLRAAFDGKAEGLTMLADAGHSMHWDQPEAALQAIVAFLRG
ncbi:MAG: alpha/beta hydrolase [Pseudomonadota bacterium]